MHIVIHVRYTPKWDIEHMSTHPLYANRIQRVIERSDIPTCRHYAVMNAYFNSVLRGVVLRVMFS